MKSWKRKRWGARKVNNTESLLARFTEIVENPKKQLDKFVSEGKKVIGCYPYYVPEELVYATGMVPMGLWGRLGTPNKAKEYFAAFYCSLVQMNLEMALQGDLDSLSGVIHTTLCDTLRPSSQNFRVGVKDIPMIFISHPQNRKPEYGIEYTMKIYAKVLDQLEAIAGRKASDEELRDAIRIYNENRQAKREFVKNAGIHPELISAVQRSAVLKSSYFMEKPEHTNLLKELNRLLTIAPVIEWKGTKVVTSGIICDNPALLAIFDEYKIAIAADDIAHKSRSFRRDAPENEEPIRALAMQFAEQNQDTILYDDKINSRPPHIVDLVRQSKANGVVILMMTFCDPEETEYPSLAKALKEEKIPALKIAYDHQITDFSRARTSLQAFVDLIG